MSADYWLETPNCHGEHSWNVTYNLGKMLRAAGFPEWRALADTPAVEAGGMLRKVADTLKADPDRFREFNPPNGWGDFEGAVEFLESFATGCAEHPEATIRACL